MKIVGVTGKVASGKSHVCRHFQTYPDAIVLDLDKLTHEVLDYPEIRDMIAMRWSGDTQFKFMGMTDRESWFTINNKSLRSLLRERVFSNSEDKKFLSDITVKPIDDLLEKKINLYKGCYNDCVKVLFLESALLFKKISWVVKCRGGIIFVDTDEETRKSRFIKRYVETHSNPLWQYMNVPPDHRLEKKGEKIFNLIENNQKDINVNSIFVPNDNIIVVSDTSDTKKLDDIYKRVK